MEPRELIEEWVAAFNRGDADEIAAFYTADAVNHQVVQDPVVGRSAIREMFARDFERVSMICKIENVFQDGNWAILEWSDPRGLRGCGFFHVQDDKIVFQRGYFDQLTFRRLHGLLVE